MLLPTLIGAAGLLATVVEAAPKGTGFNKIRELDHHARGSRSFRERVAARADSDRSYGPKNAYPDPNYYNLTKTSTSTSSHHNTDSSIECPTASLLVWTTTIDTTIFVTATSNLTYTEQPGNDDSTTARNAGLSSLLSSVTIDADDETAPAYPGPQTITVENHDSTETEPCTDDPWFTINSTITHSRPVYATPGEAYSTDTEKPVTPTTDCDDATATNGPGAAYTPPPGNFSVPHTRVVSTEPCDDETLSATLTGDPTLLTPIPYGNFSTPYAKPVGYTESPEDETSTATPVSDPLAIYSSLPFGNASTPYATPAASSEPCDDETSVISDSPASFTPLPYGNLTTPYATPAASTEPCDDETTSASADPVYTPPSGNFSIPNTKLVESTTSSAVSSNATPTTPCDDDMTTTPSLSATTVSVLPFGNTTIGSTEPCDETTTPSARASSSTEPCDESTTSWYNSPVPGNATATPSFSTEPYDETTTTPGTVAVTPILSGTTKPLATPTSVGYVIDTSVIPVSSPTPSSNSTYLQPPQDGHRRAARNLARPDLWLAQ
ncbi:hypothetical protein AK830_g4985 [Neonectria ditissima]|uniref:Ig-like domain-containing protein n=1 Tax=Neonectria ditissima TaxID=78410 RepID=A0A0P7AUN8_9HYPO|nr:hypothetical protein AK830_g4985 [Neonectria ditissima]